MGTVTFRVRSIVWFVTGAVLAAATTLMFVSGWRVDAAPGDSDATFVGITACRLADTRPAPNRVGPAATLGQAGTQTFVVHGSNGECTIPAEAVAVSMNVTALGATVQSFLTFWPDGERPLAASLNPAPGEPPTPNAVTVDLSDAGGFNVFNNAGSVDVVIDVNGYYTQTSLRELASRLAAVEAAQAAGVDPAVLDRLTAVETDTATNTADMTDVNSRLNVLETARPTSTLIPAAAFVPDGYVPESANFIFGNGYFSGNSDEYGCMIAPVQLPDGATVTDLFGYLYDNDAGVNASMALRRTAVDGTGGSLMATVATTGASTSVQAPTDTSINNEVIDNVAFSYYLTVCLLSGGVRLYGASLNYQLPS